MSRFVVYAALVLVVGVFCGVVSLSTRKSIDGFEEKIDTLEEKMVALEKKQGDMHVEAVEISFKGDQQLRRDLNQVMEDQGDVYHRLTALELSSRRSREDIGRLWIDLRRVRQAKANKPLVVYKGWLRAAAKDARYSCAELGQEFIETSVEAAKLAADKAAEGMKIIVAPQVGPHGQPVN